MERLFSTEVEGPIDSIIVPLGNNPFVSVVFKRGTATSLVNLDLVVVNDERIGYIVRPIPTELPKEFGEILGVFREGLEFIVIGSKGEEANIYDFNPFPPTAQLWLRGRIWRRFNEIVKIATVDRIFHFFISCSSKTCYSYIITLHHSDVLSVEGTTIEVRNRIIDVIPITAMWMDGDGQSVGNMGPLVAHVDSGSLRVTYYTQTGGNKVNELEVTRVANLRRAYFSNLVVIDHKVWENSSINPVSNPIPPFRGNRRLIGVSTKTYVTVSYEDRKKEASVISAEYDFSNGYVVMEKALSMEFPNDSIYWTIVGEGNNFVRAYVRSNGEVVFGDESIDVGLRPREAVILQLKGAVLVVAHDGRKGKVELVELNSSF